MPTRPLTHGELLANSVQAWAERPQVTEPPSLDPGSKHPAAGAELVESSGLVTLIEPAGHFGGYVRTFPKGGATPGAGGRPASRCPASRNRQDGFTGRIVGFVGDFPGDTTVTRYYLAVPTGGDAKPLAIAASVESVGPIAALELLNRDRDRNVMRRVLELAGAATPWTCPRLPQQA